MPELLDLDHLGQPRVIASWLLPGDEPALVDCGPASCLPALRARLGERGLAVSDLRHLVLTHIHLDHAGAAGSLVRENARLQVHVSEVGAPHLIEPTRLERSARRLYGEDFDRLWGELAPVPEANVRVVGGRVLDLEAFPTPGHASHHVSFLSLEGECYCGDVAGVRIAPATFLAPVSPPPDVDLEAWTASLDAIEEREPSALLLPHFGSAGAPRDHLVLMRERLTEWAARVREGATVEEFVAEAEQELAADVDDPALADSYRQAAPFWQSHAGLARYWAKKAERAAL
ncbi:MAG: MBL fold metallo-hydrolase [Actinomycetota bacterium]|nr:MBL fold metallo-hydrolase [Actinomycetota bacterium]